MPPLPLILLHRPPIPSIQALKALRSASYNLHQRRTFIPIPLARAAISALTGTPPKPLHFQATRTLPYPRAALYEIVADIESYPQFLPLVLEAKVLAHARTKTPFSTGPSSSDPAPPGHMHSLQQSQTQLQPQPLLRLPSLASLKLGLPPNISAANLPPVLKPLLNIPGLANLSHISDLTTTFLSAVYCNPAAGIVEAVAGSRRETSMLSASELRENGYLDDNSVNGSVMEAGIKDSGPDYFKTCRTRWVLRDLEAQVTRVELSVEVEWVHGVMAAVTGGVVEGVAEGMIAAFEWRAGRVLG